MKLFLMKKNNGMYFVHTIGTVYSNSKQYEIVFTALQTKPTRQYIRANDT